MLLKVKHYRYEQVGLLMQGSSPWVYQHARFHLGRFGRRREPPMSRKKRIVSGSVSVKDKKREAVDGIEISGAGSIDFAFSAAT